MAAARDRAAEGVGRGRGRRDARRRQIPPPLPSPRQPAAAMRWPSPPPLLAALYYVATSCALTVFNKLLFGAHDRLPAQSLLLAQSLTSVAVLALLSLTPRYNAPALPRPRTLATYAPLLAAYLAMLATSLLALRRTSLLMYNTIRRTSIVFVILLSAARDRAAPSRYATAAAVLTVAGAAAAARRDNAFAPVGYGLAVAANAATSAYLVLLKPTRDALLLTNAQLMHLNAAASAPLLIALHVSAPPAIGAVGPTSAALLACSCLLAVIIAHATAVNTVANDAVAHTLSAQVKDVVLLALSYFVIDSPESRAEGNVAGVLLGFSGSLVYVYGKMQETARDLGEGDGRPAAPAPNVSAAKLRRKEL
jgi:hypothetical protein